MDSPSAPTDRPKKRQRRLRGGDASDSDSDSELGSPAGPERNANAEEPARRRAPRGLDDGLDDLSDDDDDEADVTNHESVVQRAMEEEDEGDDGEDLMETMERDYRPIAELDRYDDDDLDNREYRNVSMAQRIAANRALDARDVQEGRRRTRVGDALMDSDDSDGESDDEEELRRRQMHERTEFAAQAEPVSFDLRNFTVPLKEWLRRDEVQHEVKREFRSFIKHFSLPGSPTHKLYLERIAKMCSENLQSLHINFSHLKAHKVILAVWLTEKPKEMLQILDEEALDIVLEEFPEYHEIHDEVYVRVTDLPIDDVLRDLRASHMDVMVKVSGVVTRRTQVVPEIKIAHFKCRFCGDSYMAPPIGIGENQVPQVPVTCDECDKGNAYELDNTKAVYRNFQIMTLQESPGTVPAGRVPRYKSVLVSGDLIDSARPGEEVEVTGIYETMLDMGLNSQNGFPVFSTRIMANYIQKREDLMGHINISEEDKATFRRMARDPQIADRIIGSLAPSIYGCREVKTAMAMALFGGRSKNINNKHRIRGDINVLLMGDPGTAKSQCLKYCEKIAPRSVYTTGKGASAVGLTAAVTKDPVTREWTLEGGALVLADQGVCLIDEFDKMNDKDRTSIHEAMEQQSISISKAGIVASLQARCSIIAAANPVTGRYDPQKTFAENVELTDPIIQRFDVLCVLQDTVDPIADERLARFVVSSHVRAHPDLDVTQEEAADAFVNMNKLSEPPGGWIDQDLLKKYICYARSLKPQLHSMDQEKLANLYAELRRESVNSGGVPIAVRHVESIIRMSEAYARIHLREQVRDEDLDMAIRVMLESFIAAQKISAKRYMRRAFQKYITYKRDSHELLAFVLEDLIKDRSLYGPQGLSNDETKGQRIVVRCADLQQRAHELGVNDLTSFYKSNLFQNGEYHLETDDRNRRIIVKEFS